MSTILISDQSDRVYCELLKDKMKKVEEEKKKLSQEGLSKFMGDLTLQGNIMHNEVKEELEEEGDEDEKDDDDDS